TPARAQNSLPDFSGKQGLLLSLMRKVKWEPQASARGGRRNDRHKSTLSWPPTMERQSQSEDDCPHDLVIVGRRADHCSRLRVFVDAPRRAVLVRLGEHKPYSRVW